MKKKKKNTAVTGHRIISQVNSVRQAERKLPVFGGEAVVVGNFAKIRKFFGRQVRRDTRPL